MIIKAEKAAGVAIWYAIYQKAILLNYLEAGEAEGSNNRADWMVKPFMMGGQSLAIQQNEERSKNALNLLQLSGERKITVGFVK